MVIKKMKSMELNTKSVNIQDNLILCKCLCWDRNYQKTFDKKLKKRFENIYKFFNYYVNKFIMLLRKGVYPHEHMDDW